MRPDLVKQVVTLGTPVVGGPTFTLAASLWGKQACREISQKIRALDHATPIKTPIIAFFSKNDGVVSWPACIDTLSCSVSHYEVQSSHWAIGFEWTVWEKMYELFTARS